MRDFISTFKDMATLAVNNINKYYVMQQDLDIATFQQR
jgi:hypothetical protein